MSSRRQPGSSRGAADRKAEMDLLRARLAEAEDTLDAIRSGSVDALLVEGEEGQ